MSKSFIFNKTVDDYSPFKSRLDCSITSVTEEMLRGITSIGYGAFYDCTSLQTIEIPNSVTSIGSYAFRECTSLQTVTMKPTTPPTLGGSVFNNTHSNLVIYVPAGSVETYKTASGWSDYASRIQAIPSS